MCSHQYVMLVSFVFGWTISMSYKNNTNIECLNRMNGVKKYLLKWKFVLCFVSKNNSTNGDIIVLNCKLQYVNVRKLIAFRFLTPMRPVVFYLVLYWNLFRMTDDANNNNNNNIELIVEFYWIHSSCDFIC